MSMLTEKIESLLVSLFRWADDDTFSSLYNFVKSHISLGKPRCSSDYRHFILKAYVRDMSITYQHRTKAIIDDYLKYITKVVTEYKCFGYLEDKGFNKEAIKNVERFIKILSEYKQFFYWSFNERNEIVIYDYTELIRKQLIFNIDRDRKILSVEQGKYFLYIKKDENKIKVENIRKLTKDFEINRFLTTYSALALALQRDAIYCPWHNPDDNLPHALKQRKCQSCDKIADFIIANDNTYNNSNLHKKVIGSKLRTKDGNELSQIIAQRRKTLLEIVDSINERLDKSTQNAGKFAISFTEIKKTIETQFRI